MKLIPEVAQEIASRAQLVLNRSIAVTDSQGRMVGGKNDGSGRTIVDALRSCQEGRLVRSSLGDAPVAWCPFVYEGRTIGAFGVFEHESQTTPEAINLLQGLAEVIVHQHFLLERVQPTDKMKAEFLKQALNSATADPAEVYRQADILQLNLRVPQAVILMEIEGFEARATREKAHPDERSAQINQAAGRITGIIAGAFKNNMENTVAYFGEDHFLLSKGIGGESLTTRNTIRFLMEKAGYIHDLLSKETGLTVSAGVGQYYPDLGGLRKGFQEAKLALTVGAKVWGAGRVYHIKQVGMFVTLANVAQERKAELAHQILYPLLKDEQLYKTVQTFLAAGLNLTEAAEKLHVHRNTLIYRLDKTKKVVGLDPRVFDDALQIKLGLMFYQEV